MTDQPSDKIRCQRCLTAVDTDLSTIRYHLHKCDNFTEIRQYLRYKKLDPYYTMRMDEP